MRLFVIASVVPHATDSQPGVTAVHRVVFELLQGLAASGHTLTFQLIGNIFRESAALEPCEREALALLEQRGIRTLEPVLSSAYQPDSPPAGVWERMARAAGQLAGRTELDRIYPAVKIRAMMQERLRETDAEAIVTLWSPEGVAATHGLKPWPRIAYHGDVDFVPTQARFKDDALFARGQQSAGPVQRISRRLWLGEFRRAHQMLMREVDVIANVTACNAPYYERLGHPRSVYVPNTWMDGAGSAHPPRASGRSLRRAVIVGHAGYLDRTGSTYGLRYLLRELLPRLDDTMQGLDYEVRIIGGGEIAPALRSRLDHPRVVVRDFVKDLEAELAESDAFLMLNNAGPYQAAFTRHLLAWSLGLCLIAHANSRLAIPEIRHRHNALLGDTPEEIAVMIRSAIEDPDLNARIRAGGRKTYEQHFRPAVVAQALSNEVVRCFKR